VEVGQNAKSTATGQLAFVRLACKAIHWSPVLKLDVVPALSVRTMRNAKTGSAKGFALLLPVHLGQAALPETTKKSAPAMHLCLEMVTPYALKLIPMSLNQSVGLTETVAPSLHA
jgi:hypothetical protein